jgi:hypothetical protein
MGRRQDQEGIVIGSNMNNGRTDSLVTSITFVAIAFHLQISEECNYYILALAYLF